MRTNAGDEVAQETRLEAALLQALTRATWPDGSMLIDVAPEILEDRLLPALTAAVATRMKGHSHA